MTHEVELRDDVGEAGALTEDIFHEVTSLLTVSSEQGRMGAPRHRCDRGSAGAGHCAEKGLGQVETSGVCQSFDELGHQLRKAAADLIPTKLSVGHRQIVLPAARP